METAMDSVSRPNPQAEQLISQIRGGEPQRIGELLQTYQHYLRLLAATQIGRRLKARISPSDLVQETLLAGYRDFAQFHGQTERELVVWLRQILIHRLHVFVRHHLLTGKRDARREYSLETIQHALHHSTVNLEAALADPVSSPSSDLIRRESAVLLADQLARLSADYREVIVLRHLHGLSFEEVACRMNRGCGAVRMLWLRAIRELRKALEEN
jgi:RNA polymerase sigma-70 factor (ECF subfamily)